MQTNFLAEEMSEQLTGTKLDLQNPDNVKLLSESKEYLKTLDAKTAKALRAQASRDVFLNRGGAPSQFWPDGVYYAEVQDVRAVDHNGRSRTPFSSVRFTFGPIPICRYTMITSVVHECPIDWRENSELTRFLAAIMDRDLHLHETNGGFYSPFLLGRHCVLDLVRTDWGKRTGMLDFEVRAIMSQSSFRSGDRFRDNPGGPII